MGVQEIGARFVVLGRAEMIAALRSVQVEVDSLNRSIVSGVVKARAVSVSNPITALAQSVSLAQSQMAAESALQLDRVSKLGKASFFGLAGAVALAGYEGIKQFSAFQAQMERVSTQAGVAESRIGALSKGILALSGPQTGQGPTALATALYRIASSNAGLHATNQELLTMTKYAGQLTVLGGPGTDLEQTARVFGGIRASGIKGGGDTAKTAAWANATVGAGDLKMSDLVNFFGTGVLPAGSLAGVNEQQLGAALALMGDNLVSGQVAGHSLTHALSLMGAPTGVAATAMQAIGMDPLAMGRTMQNQGLIPAVGQLRQYLMGPLKGANVGQLEKYSIPAADIARAQQIGFGAMGNQGKTDINELLTRMFGGAKMAVPIDTMVVEYNRLLAKQNEIAKQSNLRTYNKDLANQMDTLQFKAKAFTGALGALDTEIGGGMQPAVTRLLTVGTDFTSWLARNTPVALGLASALTAVLVPAMGVYLWKSLTKARGAIVDVVKWYGKLVKAILTQLIPSLRAETGAETTVTADTRIMGAAAGTAAGEETALGGAAGRAGVAARLGALGLLGGAATAGVASYAISSALSSHFDTGNARLGTSTAQGVAAGLSGSPLTLQYTSLESKLKADLARMKSMNNQSGLSDLFSGPAWVSALTFGAKGKEAEYNQLAGQVAEYKKEIAATQSEAAQQNINLTVNLDGKPIYKSVVSTVRRKVARS